MQHNNDASLKSGRILIVDDDTRLLTILNTRLSTAGWSCVVCDNASEAMVQFAKEDFDLVITDITMPGIDGLSVIGMIRSQSDIPVVVITGHAPEYGLLVSAFPNLTLLCKPIEARVLVACVYSLISRERLRCV
jgi:DNA-binding response OmpR family regulator